MFEKKELNKEELEKVFGGTNDGTGQSEIKCIITYKYLGAEKTEEVVFKGVDKNNVLEAVHTWCNDHLYEYVSHQVIDDDGARYRF